MAGEVRRLKSFLPDSNIAVDIRAVCDLLERVMDHVRHTKHCRLAPLDCIDCDTAAQLLIDYDRAKGTSQ